MFLSRQFSVNGHIFASVFCVAVVHTQLQLFRCWFVTPLWAPPLIWFILSLLVSVVDGVEPRSMKAQYSFWRMVYLHATLPGL